ncbi:MAG: hypothetical protein US31_C0019G0007 [Berkelbacteria bacterium GW2011_GWA1_36_9]|uniref:Uncharacterized protein n=1 Tax=Berkelbacteria bacterium GW2011_GWA1_36_9 TaxID=1618331 RepID=A0A0G0FU88_9BACT|nr:MAG: hypothetical protein US31_C0019G0007 [Berkelbacteria bacterium GW2011_GWA1_36_9]
MSLFTNLIFWVPLVLSSLIILRLFYLELKSKVTSKTAKRSLIAIILIYFLQIATQITYIYIKLKGDDFGKFLLPPKSNYLYQVAWQISSSYVFALAIGLILILVLLVLRKIFKAEILDKADFYVLLLTVFVVGASNVLILVLASFFLMIFFLIGFSFRQKKITATARVTLSPFLLLTAFAILILQNFEFYQKLLTLLRLT